MESAVRQIKPDVIGISVRNLDNSDYMGSRGYLPEIRQIVDACRRPQHILAADEHDYSGNGEESQEAAQARRAGCGGTYGCGVGAIAGKRLPVTEAAGRFPSMPSA